LRCVPSLPIIFAKPLKGKTMIKSIIAASIAALLSTAAHAAGPKTYTCTGPFVSRAIAASGVEDRVGDTVAGWRIRQGNNWAQVRDPGPVPVRGSYISDHRATTPPLRILDAAIGDAWHNLNVARYNAQHERWQPICSAAEFNALRAVSEDARKAWEAAKLRFDLEIFNPGTGGITG
jgi:hypothetical protein